MCLLHRVEVTIDKVPAWKLFSVDATHSLRSAFCSAIISMYQDGFHPNYPINRKIDVYPSGNTFYAFEDFESAYSVGYKGTSLWNVYKNLIILPVMLYNVVATGRLNDTSGMRLYDAYEAKKIKVFDSGEIRDNVNTMIIQTAMKKKHNFKDGGVCLNPIFDSSITSTTPVKSLLEMVN